MRREELMNEYVGEKKTRQQKRNAEMLDLMYGDYSRRKNQLYINIKGVDNKSRLEVWRIDDCFTIWTNNNSVAHYAEVLSNTSAIKHSGSMHSEVLNLSASDVKHLIRSMFGQYENIPEVEEESVEAEEL